MFGLTGMASPPIIGFTTDAPSTRYISSPERPPRRCNSPSFSVTPGSVLTTSFNVVTPRLVAKSPEMICLLDVSVFSIAGRSAVTEIPDICSASVTSAALTGVVTSILTRTPAAA